MTPLRSVMASLRRRPVRIRLAIFSAALTAVILIGFAAVVGRLVTNRIEADFRDDLRGTANGLALDLAASVGSSQQAIANGIEQVAMANNADIRVVDKVGQTIVATRNAPDFGPPEPGDIQEAGSSLRFVSAPVFSSEIGTGQAFVQYGQSRAGIDATIGRLWLFLGGGVLVGTLLAGIAGMTIAARAMQPIVSLTGTARTIARTRDPSMRIPEIESDDEVAELARTLDGMLRELDAARSETEAAIQRQREFVADASHELRTPLTSILANLELLEAALPAEESDEQAAARSALRSSKRMSRLVGDLLILARADAGRRSEPVDCDLSKIACEAFEEVHPVADGHELRAQIDPEAGLRGDPDELHRMVLNLLENAIRHTPDGSVVSLELERNGRQADLRVSDDGPGLPEGMDEQVFERFTRGSGPADRSGSGGDGTGLGLSIVRAVARAHGGEVVAGVSPEGGASFTVTLPLRADGSAAGHDQAGSPEASKH